MKQNIDNGIKNVLTSLQNGYSKYFNIKYDRQGPLFQSRFKAKRIETEEILLHVSRYIHLNPSNLFLIEAESLENYLWSSYPTYMGIKNSSMNFIDTSLILKIIGGEEKYKKFVLDRANYQRKLEMIKHMILEK
jgi:putative transposase